MRYTDPSGIREYVKKSAEAAERILKETHSHGVRDDEARGRAAENAHQDENVSDADFEAGKSEYHEHNDAAAYHKEKAAALKDSNPRAAKAHEVAAERHAEAGYGGAKAGWEARGASAKAHMLEHGKVFTPKGERDFDLRK